MTRNVGELRECMAIARGIHPLHDNILVLRDKPMEMVGRILLPDMAKKKISRGTVLAVGKGRQDDDFGVHPTGNISSDGRPILEVGRRPMDVAIGDRVTFNNYGGADFLYKGKMFVMLTNEHVDGIMEDDGDEEA